MSAKKGKPERQRSRSVYFWYKGSCITTNTTIRCITSLNTNSITNIGNTANTPDTVRFIDSPHSTWAQSICAV